MHLIKRTKESNSCQSKYRWGYRVIKVSTIYGHLCLWQPNLKLAECYVASLQLVWKEMRMAVGKTSSSSARCAGTGGSGELAAPLPLTEEAVGLLGGRTQWPHNRVSSVWIDQLLKNNFLWQSNRDSWREASMWSSLRYLRLKDSGTASLDAHPAVFL